MTVQRLALAIASIGGAGRFPIAPGTVGSALGLGLSLLLPQHAGCQAGTLALAAVLGVWSASVVAAARGEPDPSVVIIDELAGMLVACWMLPRTPLALGAAFALFRLFDIGKWFPMRQLERLPGGWGIMADDLAAGLITRVLLSWVR
jgi:phosphatidylglycerophosphatase A